MGILDAKIRKKQGRTKLEQLFYLTVSHWLGCISTFLVTKALDYFSVIKKLHDQVKFQHPVCSLDSKAYQPYPAGIH